MAFSLDYFRLDWDLGACSRRRSSLAPRWLTNLAASEVGAGRCRKARARINIHLKNSWKPVNALSHSNLRALPCETGAARGPRPFPEQEGGGLKVAATQPNKGGPVV